MMLQVLDLEPGTLFMLVGREDTIFTFVRNVYEDDDIRSSIVKVIANFWPKEQRGKGQPEQWVLVNGNEQNCNPYAHAKYLRIL